MKHEIKNRFTGEVLFTCEVSDGLESGMITRHAVEEAILSGADLRYADLSNADLRYADLSNADLGGADLGGADLGGADLRYADLRYADLSNADLSNANLGGANLGGAKNAPLIINGLHWIVSINGLGMMRIGCQRHKVEEWASFNDDQISEMDSHALAFWNKNKAMLLSICDSYKHERE